MVEAAAISLFGNLVVRVSGWQVTDAGQGLHNVNKDWDPLGAGDLDWEDVYGGRG